MNKLSANNINYLVWVRCATFNQAPFIEDTMNGFCIQQTEFPFVCTIIDDASTDGEQEVIHHYLQEHFDLDNRSYVINEETDDYYFTFARHRTNHNCYFAVYFLKYNHFSIKKPKTQYIKEWKLPIKYIAFCEGDDYWTDPNKLQMQVSYLESSNNCKFCYCKAVRFYQKEQTFRGFWGGDLNSLDEALILENKIPTLTICYEKEEYLHYLSEFNPDQYHWHLGDLPIFLWFASYGGVHYIDANVGVYRVLEESASHSKNPQKTEMFLNDVMNIKLLFDERYNDSKRALDIHDIFMRKFAYLNAFSLRSTKKLIKSFSKINNKKRNDYLFFLRQLLYALIGI